MAIGAASTSDSLGRLAAAAIEAGAPATSRDTGAWFVRFPPVYAVAIAIVAGDALGNLGIFPPLWAGAVLGLGALALFLGSRRSVGVAMALGAILAASTVPAHRMLAPPDNPLSIRHMPDGAPVMVEGRLIREAERFPDRMRLYVEARRVAPDGSPPVLAHGVVRVTVLRPGAFRVGDAVRFSGRIHFPRNFGDPGEFDYEGFMARQGIAATILAVAPRRGAPAVEVLAHHPQFPASAIESVRRRIAAFIDRNLDDPAAAELRALVIGDRGGIGRRMHEVFGRTGMAHLLVISGLHLSMVAAAVFAAVRFLLLLVPAFGEWGWANKGAALAGAGAVCAYAAIAGHHVSTMRALVMVLAYMFALVIGRAREAPASLAVAAIVVCFALPGSSTDLGFEFSFASVLAIVLGMRRYAAWVERRRAERGGLAGVTPPRGAMARQWALGYLAVSFWAGLGVAPLTAFYFNQLSLVSVVANAVVVPIMGFGAAVLGLFASALSLLWDAPAAVLLRAAGKFAVAGNLLAQWFADWPWAWTRIFTPAPAEIVLAYGALLAWLCWPVRWGPDAPHAPEAADAPERAGRDGPRDAAPDGVGPRPGRWRYAALAALAIAFLADAGWWTHERYFSPSLRVTFLSVGEGDAAVVRFPGSRVMLVDGGGGWRNFDMGERVVARYLWSRKIMRVDWLALSHPDHDHFGGFEFIARNFSPREFWTIAAQSRDRSYSRLLATLDELGIPVRFVDAATPPADPGGVRVSALNPPAPEGTKRNNGSMVLRLEFAGASFLFTGDLEAAGEQALLASGPSLRALVLKVPHHGSRTSSTPEFVAAVRPEAAVISLGYHNRFHFPAPEVLARYGGEGARVFRTDRDGAVMVDARASGATLATYRTGVTLRLGTGASAPSRPSSRTPGGGRDGGGARHASGR